VSDKSLTVGILGGMGPEATIDFMNRVIALTPATTDADHIRMLVDNNPFVPSRQAAILGDGPDPGPTLANMAEKLEAAGADVLVMPCNTAHAWQGDIVAATAIPFVSIIDETVAQCREFERVGLLATRACLRSELYQLKFAAAGKELLLPTDEELAEFTRLIAMIKTGEKGAVVGAAMQALAEALCERGAQAVIAGCTEIPLVLDVGALSVPLLSSTDILAEATIAIARKDAPV
jgi:aspartate racemase